MENCEFETIHLKSEDGLLITADLYEVNKPVDFILLCHRSHCNRAEYRETAPKLNTMGFSCLAIDQRSGMKVFGEVNETKNRAKEKGLPTGYLDAKQDIEAAINFSYERNNKQPIIIIASSYSASLALLISCQTTKLKAIICFSPGQYLKGIHLAEEMKVITIPTFVTSTKKEIEQVRELISYVDPKNISQFEPAFEGFHGSKALWKSVKGHEQYWKALEQFLKKLDLN